MEILGLWREYRGDPTLPSAYDANNNREEISGLEQEILSYLRNGALISGIRGKMSSIIKNEEISSPSVLSDGEWVWTSEFIHHFENQRVSIPMKFLKKMIEQNYTPPTRDELGRDKILEIAYSL